MYMTESMQVTVNTADVLRTIRENAEKHKQIVAEAREGYMKAAEKALAARLKDLRSGKLVSLTFQLAPPVDQSSVYRTVIRMLELHTKEDITLDSKQVRCLVMDEWDWKKQFLLSNSAYSATATRMMSDED
jgi:hypothetical protein